LSCPKQSRLLSSVDAEEAAMTLTISTPAIPKVLTMCRNMTSRYARETAR